MLIATGSPFSNEIIISSSSDFASKIDLVLVKTYSGTSSQGSSRILPSDEVCKILIDNDYEGVFIEKNHCLIIDQDEVTNLANTNNLFISTFEKL